MREHSVDIYGAMLLAGSAGSAGQVLTSAGAGAQTVWSTAPLTGSGTAGQVAFYTAANVLGGDTALVWDSTLNTLGINVPAPAWPIEATGLQTNPLTAIGAGLFISQTTITGADSAVNVTGAQGDARLVQGGAGVGATNTTGARGLVGIARATGGLGTVAALIGVLGSTVNSGTGPVTNTYSVYANSPTNSGGGSIGTSHGVFIPNHNTGTTIYGLRSSLVTAAGKWNIYVDGTAPNFLAGALTIDGSSDVVQFTVQAHSTQVSNLTEWQSSAAAVLASISGTGLGLFAGLSITDAKDIVFGTGTGTKIGTGTTQKIGFWNATPIVQPSGASQAAVATTAATNVTPFGYTTAAQADGIITLLNAIRTALVNAGLMKGSA